MDFEAKAREVLLELLGTFSDATDRDSLCFIADALRAAALDDDARREARAELTRLLAEVRLRALHPVLTRSASGDTWQVGQAVSWDVPAEATPVADVEAVQAAISAHVLNPATALTLPPPLAHLLERLLWLLGLSEGERRFVTALADDPGDCDTAQVYVDWLLDQTADGARLRRLVPQDGDVLVWRVPPVAGQDVAEAVCDGAARRRAALGARGIATDFVILHEGADLSALGAGGMRAAGWVRAEDVLARAGALQAYLKDRWGSAAERAVARHFQDIFDPPAPEAPP